MRKTCLNSVFELAKQDPRVVFIGSDLGPGTLAEMQHEMPERFFMEGVSEQHIIGMAAGLALDGYIPYVNTIATFLSRRCYEQVAIDLCLQNLPVRLIANGGGMVYAPLGPTHLATEDMAIMRALPNMGVVAPADAEQMARLMPQTLAHPGPLYIRLGKGGDAVVTPPESSVSIGQALVLREPGEVLLVTTGVMVQRALGAADILRGEGVECGVIDLHTVKPLDTSALLRRLPGVRLLVTVEEHVLAGGFGSAVLEELIDVGASLPAVKRLGIPDRFTVEYGSQDSLLEGFGLQPEPIATSIRTALASTQGAL
ncbi:MAG: transketolase C-terminal domain-containing protein [Sedimenticola sp.]